METKRVVGIAALAGAAIGAGVAGLRPGPWSRFDPAAKARPDFFVACVLIWAVFSLYWETAARHTARGKPSESSGSRLFHVIAVNLALLLVVLPVRGLGRYLPASPGLMAAGVAIQAMGAALAIWARVCLGQNWSGIIDIKAGHQLIRTGPYRWARHPIYTGLLAMYLGSAVVTGEWLAVAGVVVAVLSYARKLRLEEAALGAAFGGEYASYRRHTRGLIPGIF